MGLSLSLDAGTPTFGGFALYALHLLRLWNSLSRRSPSLLPLLGAPLPGICRSACPLLMDFGVSRVCIPVMVRMQRGSQCISLQATAEGDSECSR